MLLRMFQNRHTGNGVLRRLIHEISIGRPTDIKCWNTGCAELCSETDTPKRRGHLTSH
jgi:hypothetical protein